jgi:undecaprenyl-diphosphatase
MAPQAPAPNDAGRRLSTRRWARLAGALVLIWIVLVALFVVGGEGIKHSSAINSADRRITTFVVAHRTTALNQTMKIVTWSGSWIAVLVVATAAVVLAWRRRLPPLAVAILLTAWMGELLAVTLTKSLVRRNRPPESVRLVIAHGWSFPSGHTANAVIVAAAAAALVARLAGAKVVRLLSWIVAVLFVALVGFSRIELGVHWTTDVLSGAVWAGCWTVIVVAVVRFLSPLPGSDTRQNPLAKRPGGRNAGDP